MNNAHRIWENEATGAELWMGGFPQGNEVFTGDAVVALAGEGPTYGIWIPENEMAWKRPLFVSWPIDDGNVIDPDHLRALAQYLAALLVQGKKVLVHCGAGWNRSGLVVARTLITMGFEPLDAVALIRERRNPNALSNGVFGAWLVKERPPGG